MFGRSGKAGARLRAILFCAAFLLIATSAGADDYSQWTYSSAVILNTTAAGANVTGNVTNFPILIRLNPGNFPGFANTLPGGADIRFAKRNGTHLAYQIERWVDGANSNDTAEIWVKLDTVYGNNSTQSIQMYWGKSGTADSSRGSNVFQTSNGFVAVYHLNEGGTGTRLNSAQAAFNGTPVGYDGNEGRKGIIANGDSLETNDYVTCGNITTRSQLTVSAWVRPQTFVPWGPIINKEWSDANTDPYQVYSMQLDSIGPAGPSAMHFVLTFGGAATVAMTTSKMPQYQWTYLAGTYDGANVKAYFNGTAEETLAQTGSIDSVPTSTTIAVNDSNGAERFNGIVDEVRIENVGRSADWEKLCYQNQQAGQKLVSSIILPPANLTYPANPASYIVGTAIVANSPMSNGGAVASYSVTPALPAGLTLAAATGVITGTPTTAQAAATYTVTATNAAGSASASLSIAVAAALAAPSNLTYSTNPATYIVGTAITANSPTSSGGAVVSYSVAPVLPPGLALNATTGVITGTPTTAAAAVTYTVTASNAAGSTTALLSVTISAALAPPTNLRYSSNSVTYVIGIPITPDTAFVNGTVDSFTVVPAILPAGLSFAKATGMVSGTPTTATSLAAYTVTAKNAAGIATTALSITVIPAPPKAYFKASAVTGKIPLVVTFTDSSSGTITKRYWYFGDNTAIDSTVSPVHTYAAEGSFPAKLVVFDVTGKRADSMTVVIKTYTTNNPILISGRLVPPGSVEITYTNYGGLPVGPLAPYADSVALWYAPGSIPLSSTGATYAKSYLPAAMQSSGQGAPIKDVIPIPQPFTNDTYGFVTAVHWSDGTWSKFAAGNGCLVLVKDTSTPVNACVIRGKYLGTDSAAVVIDSMKTIDLSSQDMVGIWYGSLPTDTVPNFADSSAARWYKLTDLAATITATGKDSIVIVNPQYNTRAVKTVWCAMMLQGKNGKFSAVKKASFSVGVNPPANPVVLTAVAQSASKIQLSWPLVSGVSGIRIVYRADTAVPVNSYFFDTTRYFVASPAVSDTAIIVTGLQPLTHYYFGAQVYKSGQWSVVTQNASASAVTLQATPKLDANRIKLDSLSFDPVANQVRVYWKAPGAAATDSLQVGISYSSTGYPDSTQSALVQKVVPVNSSSGTMTAITINNLLFNTLYYVSLWESRVDGSWTPPTDSSHGTLTTPDYNWQSVMYFTKVPGDTAFAFNNNIRIITDSVVDVNVSYTPGKVVYYKPDPSLLAGFVPASVAFTFSQPQSTAPFYVGLRFVALPVGYSASDLRMYRFHDSVWTVESTTVMDAQAGYVSVKTRSLDDAFMLMLDTVPATVIAEAHSAVVSEFADLRDTFTVSDNVANVKYQFMCAMGGDAYSAGSVTGSTLGYKRSGQVYTSIPYTYVTGDNGVRARFIVSDGVHTTVRDVSRQVRRVNSDFVHTEPQKWEALRVTALLDSPQVRYALRALRNPDDASTPWQYNTKEVRLFKWYPNTQNLLSDQKWVEYSDGIADVFNFQPGGLIWIKTRDATAVNFGGGVTPPLDATYTVPIAPNTWTDFAMPYKFNVKVGDIIDSTLTGTLNADSLEIYAWKRDSVGVLQTQPVYIADLAKANLADKTARLECLDLAGYTIRSPLISEQITLRVPPIPEAMSRYSQGNPKRQGAQGAQSSPQSSDGWAIKVISSVDGSRLTDVYCVYDPSKAGPMRYYPLAPTFGQAYVGVYDPERKKVFGHALAGATTNGGCAYRLAFVNGSQAGLRISYRCEAVGPPPQVPGGMKAKIYNEELGRYEDETGVDVAGGTTQYRWLFVGSAGYLAKAPVLKASVLGLMGTYPNPFFGVVRIRYSLPTSGIESVKFTICDLRGTVVWRQTVACRGRIGAGELTWNVKGGPGAAAAAGIYVLKMSALDAKGKQAGVFERKMTLLP